MNTDTANSNLISTENGARQMHQHGYVFKNLHLQCIGTCRAAVFVFEEVWHMRIENMYLV
jgi:hypothetical protein